MEKKRFMEKRQQRMLLQGIGSIIVALLTIFLAWLEIGWGLFREPIFYVLLIWWLYVGLIQFALRWEEAGKKNTDDKIDELIKEIRLDRKQREKELKLWKMKQQ